MHRLTAICVRHPWVTVVLVALLTAASVHSILQTEIAVGNDAHLGPSHTAVVHFDEFLERFGGGYPILIAYECADPGVCRGALDPIALEMAYSVSHELERSPFVSRVSSPATTRLLVANTDLAIDARRLVVDGKAVIDPELERIALGDPLWTRSLLSEDGGVGAIVIEMSSTETAALLSIMEDVRSSLSPYVAGGFRFHLVGEAVMWIAAHEDAVSSAMRVGIGTGGMLFLTLMFLLRSLPAVLASLVTIGVASAWTIGSLPLLGWQLSELTNGAATLILVIGCADCVHLVSHFLETRPRFDSDAEALASASQWVLAPCFLTTATSAGAFASFASGGVHSLTQFGLLAAMGVVIAFFLTFSLLPAALVLLPPRPRTQRHAAAWQEVLRRIAHFGTRRRWLVLAISGIIAVVGAAGIPKLRVELGLNDLWGPDHEISRALRMVSENLQRADRLEVEIDLAPDARIEDPDVVRTLATIEAELSRLDGLGQSRSLVRMLQHADHLVRPNSKPDRIPDSEAAIGELLLLLAAGDPGSVDPWMTLDQRRLRISFEAKDLSLPEKQELLSSAESVLKEAVPPTWSFSLTGTVMLAYRHGAEFGRSQLSIVSISSFVVVALIGLYLRSVPWALLATIPNAVALLLLFGAMGHWGIALNFGSAIVAPIAIGIAADDTIHFLTAYARQRRSGLQPVLALERAISGVGEAVIATALALALGFLSMTTSPFPSISNIGLLGAIAIIGATVADLLILPALIAVVASWRGFAAPPDRNG
jgi:hypothetical protein